MDIVVLQSFHCSVFIIAPLNSFVIDVVYSLSDFCDFICLVYIFHFPVYAICCFGSPKFESLMLAVVNVAVVL